MTNAQLRLQFAGAFTLLAVLCTVAVVLASMIKGYTPEATLALAGPFAVITTSGVTFFLGHQNGISEVNEKGDVAAKLVADAAIEATRIVAEAARTAAQVAAEAAITATKLAAEQRE